MGCDIHATLEKKAYWNFETGRAGETGPEYTWVSAGYPFEDASARNYGLFSALAYCGRNPHGQVPISQDRGLPTTSYKSEPNERYQDISREFEAYAEKRKDDGHGHGWATLTEIRAYDPVVAGFDDGWVDGVREALFKLQRRMERVADEYDGDGEAVRIVFFFDN